MKSKTCTIMLTNRPYFYKLKQLTHAINNEVYCPRFIA